ncbi:MAG: hypothetical protein LBJ32_04815 [Oscillospiraceae bacterium]|jgi:hypothetical protein|nr:hypothetical protein [Oscillospiraceae bacterium]
MFQTSKNLNKPIKLINRAKNILKIQNLFKVNNFFQKVLATSLSTLFVVYSVNFVSLNQTGAMDGISESQSQISTCAQETEVLLLIEHRLLIYRLNEIETSILTKEGKEFYEAVKFYYCFQVSECRQLIAQVLKIETLIEVPERQALSKVKSRQKKALERGIIMILKNLSQKREILLCETKVPIEDPKQWAKDRLTEIWALLSKCKQKIFKLDLIINTIFPIVNFYDINYLLVKVKYKQQKQFLEEMLKSIAMDPVLGNALSQEADRLNATKKIAEQKLRELQELRLT